MPTHVCNMFTASGMGTSMFLHRYAHEDVHEAALQDHYQKGKAGKETTKGFEACKDVGGELEANESSSSCGS